MLEFIINPAAGGNKARRCAKEIYNFLNEKKIAHKLYFSEHPTHIAELAKEITSAKGEHKLIIVGGDGTFHQALNGIEDFERTVVGFIPSGTTNDFARAMKLKEKPLEALKDILAENTGVIDYMQCGSVRFLNAAAAGFYTEVLYKYSKRKLFRGRLGYLFSFISALLKFKPQKLCITADGHNIEGEFMLAACCNGSRLGSSVFISPNSNLLSGKMNVILVYKTKKLALPFVLSKIKKGMHLKGNRASELICEHIKIHNLNRTELFQADGEIYKDMPFEAEIIKGGLRVFLPDDTNEKVIS